MGRIWNEETGEVYPLPEDNPEAIYARYGTDFLSLSRNVYASEDFEEHCIGVICRQVL